MAQLRRSLCSLVRGGRLNKGLDDANLGARVGVERFALLVACVVELREFLNVETVRNEKRSVELARQDVLCVRLSVCEQASEARSRLERVVPTHPRESP